MVKVSSRGASAMRGRMKLAIEVKVKPSGGTAPVARPAAGAKNSDHFGCSPVQWKVCGRYPDVRLGVWETGVNPLPVMGRHGTPGSMPGSRQRPGGPTLTHRARFVRF